MKRCKKCGIIKPFNEFHNEKRNTDGLRGSCRKCYNKCQDEGRTDFCECGNPKRKKSKICKPCEDKLKSLRAQGNKRKTSAGYILVKNSSHPYANKAGYVREHRLIMEGILGRYLLPHENVHHKNTVRHDNDESNLELWTKSQPQGMRVEDAILYYINQLDLYGYDVIQRTP